MMPTNNLLKSFLILFFFFPLSHSFAQNEHPEHPTKGEKEENPKKKDEKQDLTIEELADAAKAHIQEKTEENGGHFPVEDKKQGRTLELKLKKVHRKRLSHLGNNMYFVCADFKGKDGKTYDVDIFMKGSSKENLEVAREPMVHKVNGEARYTWHEEDGIWKKRMKGESKKKKEHPEHPEHPDD